MKPWVKDILLLVCLSGLLWIIHPPMEPSQVTLTQAIQGELKTADHKTEPATGDHSLLCNVPSQIPSLLPNQSSRLLTLAKYRTSTLRTNILRRNTNRLSDNFYTPIAATGRLVIERMSAPLRHTRANHFYVLELCRLLC